MAGMQVYPRIGERLNLGKLEMDNFGDFGIQAFAGSFRFRCLTFVAFILFTDLKSSMARLRARLKWRDGPRTLWHLPCEFYFYSAKLLAEFIRL